MLASPFVLVLALALQPDIQPTLDLRLVPLKDGVLQAAAGGDRSKVPQTKIFKVARWAGVDLAAPEHPLVAYTLRDGKLFYVFYKTVDNAFGDRPYLIQRIKKTIREYSSADDLEPRETVTYLVEALETVDGALKRPDQHFGRFSIRAFHKREIIKEYEIGFGAIPGICSQEESPIPAGHLYEEPQPYGPNRMLFDQVEFVYSKKWSLSVCFSEDGEFSIKSPEFDIDAPHSLPTPETATPVRDPASKSVLLKEGHSVLGLRVGRSRAADIQRKLGPPLGLVRASKGAQNYSHKRGLTFNVYDGGPINTIFTRSSFGGKTSKGVRHGDTRRRVQAVYGKPPRDKPDDNSWYYPEGVIFYFDAEDRVTKIVIFKPRR